MFLDKDKFLGEGLTYDDVLLMPGYSDILSWFTERFSYMR